MDWAAMIMNMYRSWAQRRGYTVTIIEEMPGELAGIKVYLFSIHFPSLNPVSSPLYTDLLRVVPILRDHHGCETSHVDIFYYL
jgi:hypothetical protein